MPNNNSENSHLVNSEKGDIKLLEVHSYAELLNHNKDHGRARLADVIRRPGQVDASYVDLPEDNSLTNISWLHPSHPGYQYLVLVAACLLTFGSYFCYDTPGALVSQLQRSEGSPMSLTAFQFNLLNSFYSWPNIVLVFVGGYIIDQVGNRRSASLFLTLVVLGQLTMTMAVFFTSFPWLLAGRFLFGVGAESLVVCQNTIVAKWFKGKELAMAMGISLTVSRLGSIICFNTLPSVADHYGVVYAFWVGLFVCFLSALSLFAFLYLDAKSDNFLGIVEGEPDLTKDELKSIESNLVIEPAHMDNQITHTSSLSFGFWICVVVLTLSYGSIMSFIAIGVQFLQERFYLTGVYSGFLVSMIYNVSMFLAPPLGKLLDIYGQRGTITAFGSMIMVAAFVPLSFVSKHSLYWHSSYAPVSTVLLLGVALSALSSAVWPAVASLADEKSLGVAIGIAQAGQNLGIAVSSLLTGTLLDYTNSWSSVMKFLFSLALTASILGVIWNVHDYMTDGGINKPSIEELEEGVTERPLIVQVSPMFVMVVRRHYYAHLGVGEEGMRRRDYYRSLGIYDIKTKNYGAILRNSGNHPVQSSPENIDSSSMGNQGYIPPLLRNSNSSRTGSKSGSKSGSRIGSASIDVPMDPLAAAACYTYNNGDSDSNSSAHDSSLHAGIQRTPVLNISLSQSLVENTSHLRKALSKSKQNYSASINDSAFAQRSYQPPPMSIMEKARLEKAHMELQNAK